MSQQFVAKDAVLFGSTGVGFDRCRLMQPKTRDDVC